MPGALYDVHTISHTWNVGIEIAGATIQAGLVCPVGERLLSAFGLIRFGGGRIKALAVEKYEFGEMANDPDSEGCWGYYFVEADVDQLGGTGYLYAVCAMETNPE